MKRYHDIPGDGGSEIVEHVGVFHQRLVDRLTSVRHLVAVGSGKGGVGKSTVTANLAAALAARGLQVGVLDLDLHGPTQPQFFGLLDTPVRSPKGMIPPAAPCGVHVLSLAAFLKMAPPLRRRNPAAGGEPARESMERTGVRELLARTQWGRLDYLVVDLPPGADRLTDLTALIPRPIDSILVTQPSEVSQSGVARSVVAAREHGINVVGLVENMASYRCANCREVSPLFHGEAQALADAMLVPLLVRLPFDPAVARASDRGAPIVVADPASAAARNFRALADKIHSAMEGGTI